MREAFIGQQVPPTRAYQHKRNHKQNKAATATECVKRFIRQQLPPTRAYQHKRSHKPNKAATATECVKRFIVIPHATHNLGQKALLRHNYQLQLSRDQEPPWDLIEQAVPCAESALGTPMCRTLLAKREPRAPGPLETIPL